MSEMNMGDGYGTPADDAREALERVIEPFITTRGKELVDALLARPDVVLRALGAVKCWHPQGTEKPLVPHWWFPSKQEPS